MRWTSIKKRSKSLSQRRTLWSPCFQWRHRMSKRPLDLNCRESKRKLNDILLTKKLKTWDFNDQLPIWKEKKHHFSNNYWDSREELWNWKVGWIGVTRKLIKYFINFNLIILFSNLYNFFSFFLNNTIYK